MKTPNLALHDDIVTWVVISSPISYSVLHVIEEYYSLQYTQEATKKLKHTGSKAQYMKVEMSLCFWEQPNWESVWFQHGQLGSISYEASFLNTSVMALEAIKFIDIIF
jgi:hypothetical protein